MPESKRPLKVFLCHARADKQKVRELYRYLRRRGIRPWFDEVDLVGGQDWQVEIPKALATSDAIIICLTKNSVDKEGYIQKEIKFALDKALEMPEGRIFLIPIRFEECEVPFSLSRYQWVDLFDELGYARMMRALKLRASQLERATIELPQRDVEEEKLGLEKAAREKEEREAAREKAKHEVADKAEREKAEREATEKAAREKAKREVTEKAKRQKAERRAIQLATLRGIISNSFIALKSTRKNAKPFLRVIGLFGIVVLLLWGGSWATPRLISLIPTATSSMTQSLTPTITSTHSATPTKTPTSTPRPLPTSITDAKGVQMALVPAGKFTMGDVGGEFASIDEKPAHIVYLNTFYIDKYETTNALYEACVETGACGPPKQTISHTRSSYYGNSEFDNYPVINVDWDMAKTYCEWRAARLPTEAEWEKVAVGAVERLYLRGGIDCNGCVGDTVAVGSNKMGQTIYGVYDMVSNVWEWVADWYSATYYQNSPSDNPPGPETGEYRVLRGGVFGGDPLGTVPPSNRSRNYPSYFHYYLGFRCARSVP